MGDGIAHPDDPTLTLDDVDDYLYGIWLECPHRDEREEWLEKMDAWLDIRLEVAKRLREDAELGV